MISKLILGIGLVVVGIGFWLPRDVQAIVVYLHKSIDCTQFVKGGTNLSENEQAFVCGIALKEIATVCCNKPGCDQNESNSASHNFALTGTKLKFATSDANVKTKNGLRPVEVEITDDDIRTIVNEWNYDCLNGRGPAGCQVVNLTAAALCKPNWTLEWGVSRADSLAMTVIRPVGGSNDFQPCTLKVYPASVDPRLDPNGPPVVECIPNQDIFKDCRREQSGLKFYDVAHSPVPAGNKAFIQECVIFRDVNKDPAFSLTNLGTYNPDVDHFDYPSNTASPKTFDSPFDGTSDEGGLWLTNLVKGAFYTGMCHQHGSEQVGGGKTPSVTWKQTGPLKPQYDSSGKVIAGTGDPSCTGGSELMDGVDYNTDGVLP